VKTNRRLFYLEGDRWRKKGSRNGKRDGKVSIGLTMTPGSDVLWQAGGGAGGFPWLTGSTGRG